MSNRNIEKFVIDPQDVILITGATGFLGHHIEPVIRSNYRNNIITVGSSDYDLTHESNVEKIYKDINPSIVIHLAAHVGGIGANQAYPADFFYRNIMINSMTIHYACLCGVKKLLTFIGGCSYPALAENPISENQMWSGYPQMESAPYSVAKKMALVQSEAYRRQYGFNSIVLIPGNVYGECDNFSLQDAHVIPAMIRKFYEAKLKQNDSVILWGSGKPVRDFVYAADVAKVIPYFVENYNTSEPINISTGLGVSIKELAQIIKELIGYKGQIIWDTSKPDGQMNKIFSADKLKSLGLSCPTSLKEGLTRTINWFTDNYSIGKVRL